MSLRLVRRGRSPHYYVRGAVRGIRIFQTTGTYDQKIADAFRIRLESELLHRSIFGMAATVTFVEAAVSYLQGGGEPRFLGRYDEKTGKWTLLIGHFLDLPIGKIGQDETDQAAYKLYPDASPATRKRQVYTPMAAVLHHAAGKGWIRAPVIKQPKVKQPETRYSSVDR